MGIPFETWDHIIGFLEGEPYPLLACCLTCRAFLEHAYTRLRSLSTPRIFLHDYTDIDNFAEDIRTIPGRAQTIRELYLRGRPPLAFSIVPHRLAINLVNLWHIDISHIFEVPSVHFSTWFLFGSAFPRVALLNLNDVQFPAYADFLRFIASFRALKDLGLRRTSFAQAGVPLRFPQFLRTIHVRLSNIEFPSFEGFLRFVASFPALKELYLETILFTHSGVSLISPQKPSATVIFLFSVKFLSFRDFLRFVASFHTIDTLELNLVSFTHRGDPLRSPQFPNVTKATLRRIEFLSFEDILHFLASFHVLRKLTFRAASFLHPGIPLEFPRFVNVTEISFYDTRFPSFETFQCLISHFRTLAKLHLVSISYARLDAPPTILQFPSVVDLYLDDIQFPSFEASIRFLASFNTLQSLTIRSILFAHPGAHLNPLELHCTLNPLERLTLCPRDEDEGRFLEPLSLWFFTRRCVIRRINISQTVGWHPSSWLLLQSIDTCLQELSLSTLR